MDVHGSLSLSDGTVQRGSECSGGGGYDDIDLGAQVTVSDEKGETIGASALDAGSSSGDGECVFTFDVSVPTGKKFYGITISHRGTVQYTEAQMQSGPELSLGDD